MKVLLGVTGSVAASLSPKLITAISLNHSLQVIATKASLYFWQPQLVSVPVWQDEDEWQDTHYVKGSVIPHIELREWADVLIIAPLTANTLAKLANGVCDNLLTCVSRAWLRTRPIIIAPAMNSQMWTHPLTEQQLKQLQNWYQLTVISPLVKKLACGESGPGAMADIADIVRILQSLAEG